MSLPTSNVEVGEIRQDPADLKDYIWTGAAWVAVGAGTPSSSTFPDGEVVGEERVDILTGGVFRWSGSVWVLKTSAGGDADQDGVTDHAELADVATSVAGGNTTTLKGAIPYNAAANTTTMLPPNVGATKKFLSQTGTGTNGAAPVWSDLITIITVSVAAATSGTATVPAGAVIVGYSVSAVTGTASVKTLAISGTTLTATLSASDTATVKVAILA